MGVSGRVFSGAEEQLRQLIEEQIVQEQMTARKQEAEARRKIDEAREARQAQAEASDTALRGRQMARVEAADAAEVTEADRVRRIGDQVSGLQDFPPDVQRSESRGLLGRVNPQMALQGMAAEPPAPRRRPVVANVGGKPVNLTVGEDEAVEEYRAPEKPNAPERVDYDLWIGPQGQYRRVGKHEQPPEGFRPYDAAGERNKPSGEPSTYATERATRTIESIDELLPKVSRWTTGVGAALSNIPETEAKGFAAQLDTLKANIAFNELTQMREASKTGGALGAVSNVELGLLSSALGSLDRAQRPEDVKAQLSKIRSSVERWQNAQKMSAGGVPSPGRTGAGVNTDVEYMRGPNGTLVRKP